jgi:hypothetical protein
MALEREIEIEDPANPPLLTLSVWSKKRKTALVDQVPVRLLEPGPPYVMANGTANLTKFVFDSEKGGGRTTL